jgi:hypothetical protein
MKFLFGWMLFLSHYASAETQSPNLLVVDSAFPPIVHPELSFTPPSCAWLREDNVPIADEGPCYDVAQWSLLTKSDVKNLQGLVDSLSGTESPEATGWEVLEKKRPDEASRVKGRYLLAVHGTRSVAVALMSSQGRVRPLALRSLTSRAGRDHQQVASIPARGRPSFRPQRTYTNGCSLRNWSPADLTRFESGDIQDFQGRIAAQLEKIPSIRVVNLSLGYKRSWIAEDFPKCNPDQVGKEFSVLLASWRNLLARFPERLFVVAAGNESENFDRSELRENDLWGRLAGTPNLLLVGAMTAHGTRLESSNYGLAIDVFALGEKIPARSPLPNKIEGHASRLNGTSFSAPLVSGRAAALWEDNKDWTLSTLKARLIQVFNEEQLKLLFANFEKLCRGNQTLDACLDAVTELISRPLLWADTHQLYIEGRRQWGAAPFLMQFQKDLPALGQTRLVEWEGAKIPALLLRPTDNPYELLITIHHEIYHFSTMREASKSFFDKGTLQSCVSPYQLALLKDEMPAYLKEMEFFESAPQWFKNKLRGKKYRSEIFGKNLDAPSFYKEFRRAVAKNPAFLIKRFVELGIYPPCVLQFF